MNACYRFVHHLDAPKRVYSLTLDELAVVIMGLAFLVLSNHKVVVTLLGFSFLSGLRVLKKGHSPCHLLVLGYWYLPHSVMQVVLPGLPASYQRLWLV